jgi:hypothetical protein
MINHNNILLIVSEKHIIDATHHQHISNIHHNSTRDSTHEKQALKNEKHITPTPN